MCAGVPFFREAFEPIAAQRSKASVITSIGCCFFLGKGSSSGNAGLKMNQKKTPKPAGWWWYEWWWWWGGGVGQLGMAHPSGGRHAGLCMCEHVRARISACARYVCALVLTDRHLDVTSIDRSITLLGETCISLGTGEASPLCISVSE